MIAGNHNWPAFGYLEMMLDNDSQPRRVGKAKRAHRYKHKHVGTARRRAFAHPTAL
jgi:hypothetical protein